MLFHVVPEILHETKKSMIKKLLKTLNAQIKHFLFHLSTTFILSHERLTSFNLKLQKMLKMTLNPSKNGFYFIISYDNV